MVSAMSRARPQKQPLVRQARPRDAEAITRIDAGHTDIAKPEHWKTLLAKCRQAQGLALVVEVEGMVVGYVLGEVRAWEFGSPPTGWIHAMGVDPTEQEEGLGRRLVEAAYEHFAAEGVEAMRTMVRREDVGLLRFFRGAGFVAGPFVQLEMSCGDHP